jgi:hypothetical protein
MYLYIKVNSTPVLTTYKFRADKAEMLWSWEMKMSWRHGILAIFDVLPTIGLRGIGNPKSTEIFTPVCTSFAEFCGVSWNA